MITKFEKNSNVIVGKINLESFKSIASNILSDEVILNWLV
jgi:hypothetical protein